MCTGDRLESAFAAALDELLTLRGVELALLIVDVSPPPRLSLRAKLKRILSLDGNLWAIVRRLFPLRRLPCYRPRDMSAVFAGVPRLHCRVTRNGAYSEYFDPDDIEEIRRHGLDFILRFAFGIVRGDILHAARYGVWSFHHGDESVFRGAPPAFWEMYYGEPTTGAMLQRLTDRLDGGIVLQKCHVRTHRWSYAASLDRLVWATTYMPARVCRDMLAGCARYLDASPSPTQASVFRAPSDLQMTWFLLKTWIACARAQLEGVLFTEDWNVGIVRHPVHAFLTPGFQPQIQWLPDGQRYRFRADPFVHDIGQGKLALLFEEFDHIGYRGAIGGAEVDERGIVRSSPHPAIDNGAHLSYPYLVEHHGQLYCIPESSQSGTVSV